MQMAGGAIYSCVYAHVYMDSMLLIGWIHRDPSSSASINKTDLDYVYYACNLCHAHGYSATNTVQCYKIK